MECLTASHFFSHFEINRIKDQGNTEISEQLGDHQSKKEVSLGPSLCQSLVFYSSEKPAGMKTLRHSKNHQKLSEDPLGVCAKGCPDKEWKTLDFHADYWIILGCLWELLLSDKETDGWKDASKEMLHKHLKKYSEARRTEVLKEITGTVNLLEIQQFF